MQNDEYEYAKKELIRRKTYPYYFHNEPLAKEFFKRFKAEVPTASYYAGEEIGQAICYDDRARKRLLKYLETLEDRHKVAMVRLGEIGIDIQSDLGHPFFTRGGKKS